MMQLYALADWSIVVALFVLVVTLLGIGLGKVFALMDRVARLEDWAGEVQVELLTLEQAGELRSMRKQMDEFPAICAQLDRMQFQLDALYDGPEQASA
ncbi:hypothetical protein [Nocardia sp. NPDC051570]|uniref:hypothetical protein n=1 Tax=Nocardia sp. NPDC051570 TaxID=3364324 RepID=UPI0037A2A3D8